MAPRPKAGVDSNNSTDNPLLGALDEAILSSKKETPNLKKNSFAPGPVLEQHKAAAAAAGDSLKNSKPYPSPFYNSYNNPLSTGSSSSILNLKSNRFSNSGGVIMSRPTGKVEDGSVMTNGTFCIMARPDGTRGCVKHPQLVLEGWTCPECEKEFSAGNNALQARKANLDNRLQELGQQQQQQQQQQATATQPQQQALAATAAGAAAHSPLGPMSVQQAQQAAAGLYGAPPQGGPPPMALSPYGAYGVPLANPMASMSMSMGSMGGPPGTGGPPSASSSTSLDTLALQINRMQQMQDWMLLQKEREVQMLRQELAEANQKLHKTQLEHALLQEKMSQQKIQHEQEIKYLQLTAAAGGGFQLPSNPGGGAGDGTGNIESALKDMKVAAAVSQNTPLSSMTGATVKDANSKTTLTSGPAVTGNNSSTTTPAGVLKQAPGAPQSNNVGSAPAAAAKVMNQANGVVANGVPNNTNNNLNNLKASTVTAPVNNTSSPAKKTAPKKNPPPAEVPKKAGPAGMKQPPPPSTVNANPANNNNGKNTTNPNGGSKNNATSGKNKSPPMNHIQKHPPPPSKNDFGIPIDINVDDDAPPTVPLQEDITLGTLGKTQSWKTSVLERTTRNTSSDRFEPRYIGNAKDSNNNSNNNSNNPSQNDGAGGEGMDSSFPTPFPSDQQSLTVASSTYGEDRQKVVNQSLLDPYGDKGIYTGLILKSTGMPHGSGRMIYEEDQRIYEGEWRHGRWHGFGRAKFANGDSYEGEYRFDQRHGNGKYSWADGRSYDGQFSEDRRHGKGLFVWPDGAIYEGQFANGQREGHGSYKFSDGGQYTGDWKDGRYNGFGTCSWEDGRCYRGEWRNGMAHGKGIETYADGTVRHDGQWIDDEPVR